MRCAGDLLSVGRDGYELLFFFQAEDGIRDLTVTGVQTCALPISVVEAMLRDTGGNPFFVSEVVRLLASEGQLERLTADASGPLGVPPSVREVIGQRLARLSPAARDLLDLAATIRVEMPLAVPSPGPGQPAQQGPPAPGGPPAGRPGT